MMIPPPDQSIKKILLPLFSASVFLLLLLSPLLYYSFSSRFYAQHTTSTVQSLNYVQNIYAFIQGKSSLDPIFPSAEKNHLEDVKQIFRVIFIIEVVALITFLLSLVVLVLQKRFSFIIRGFLRGSFSALIFFLLLLFAILINFQNVFIWFHKIFFPQGNWSFYPSSLLIGLFSLTFFKAIAIRIFFVSAGISLLIFVLDLWERKCRRKK